LLPARLAVLIVHHVSQLLRTCCNHFSAFVQHFSVLVCCVYCVSELFHTMLSLVGNDSNNLTINADTYRQ
ncbi:MAG: hypothetical protein ACKPKO_47930, partial [Candidatus Fonsibacter sp.]